MVNQIESNRPHMEMYNKQGLPDNTAMLRDTNLTSEPPSLEQHPEVSRVRGILLVLLGIDLVLYLINFLFVIHSYASSESLESQSPNSSSQLASIIIFLIYYGFGLLVVYRYYQTGLLVFTMLGPVSLALLGTVLVTLIIRIQHTTKHMGVMTAGTVVAIIFVALCLLASLLQIICIGYAFKLYRLLKNNRHLTIEQI